MSGHGQPKRNLNLRLTLVKNKYAVGVLIFPKENFCFSLPPPQPAPSVKLLHIPVVISHHWLLVAKTEGNEPMMAAAPDSQIAAWISVLLAQCVLCAKHPARGGWQAGFKAALKKNWLCVCLFVVNTQVTCVRA